MKGACRREHSGKRWRGRPSARTSAQCVDLRQTYSDKRGRMSPHLRRGGPTADTWRFATEKIAVCLPNRCIGSAPTEAIGRRSLQTSRVDSAHSPARRVWTLQQRIASIHAESVKTSGQATNNVTSAGFPRGPRLAGPGRRGVLQQHYQRGLSLRPQIVVLAEARRTGGT